MAFHISTGIQPKPLKVVVYGPEGIGKTTFASMAPDPLFIDTEGSTARMDVKRFPAPSSLTMLLEEIRYAAQTPGLCKTLVLDTADWAERMCRDDVCAKYNVTGIEDFGYGKGFTFSYEAFGKILNSLDEVISSGIHVIVNAHAAMRKFEQPDETGSYDRWELKLQNSQKCSIAGMVKEWADMVLFANYETYVVQTQDKKNKAQGGRRVMYTTHHPCWDAKNRFGLLDKLPFEFGKIAHCFSVCTPATPPAPEPAPVEAPPQKPKKQPNPDADLPYTYPETAPKPDPDGIPSKLLDMMTASGITEAQIRKVVGAKGYYPESTPIKNYAPDFVDGWVVACFPQIVNFVKENNL